jgi:osmotically-inducible protein OsmY
MQRAGQRPASFRATPPSASNQSAVVTVRLLDESALRSSDSEKVPASGDNLSRRGSSCMQLEIAIRQRIEGRLQRRVRNLNVRAYENLVVLEGQCTTYYTKQLAQHAAMGILEDEQLENAIVVSIE